MRVIKTDGGRYEAITNVNGYSLPLLSGLNIPVAFVGYGDTHFEAIERCLKKVDLFVKNQFERSMDDTEDVYEDAREIYNELKNNLDDNQF